MTAIDRIANKSVGILQLDAIILAVLTFPDGQESQHLFRLCATVLVIFSGWCAFLNLHLFMARDLSRYGDPERFFSMQIALFQKRARSHTLALFLSMLGLLAALLSPYEKPIWDWTTAAVAGWWKPSTPETLSDDKKVATGGDEEAADASLKPDQPPPAGSPPPSEQAVTAPETTPGQSDLKAETAPLPGAAEKPPEPEPATP